MMTDSDKTTGANLGDITFTSVWSQQPSSAAKQTKSHHDQTGENCWTQCHGTLVLVILSFLCFLPAGSIAIYFYQREETCKAVSVSIFGIIMGTLASIVTIIVLTVLVTANIEANS